MDAIQELDVILSTWIRWFRLRRGWTWGGRGLTAGLGFAVLSATILVMNKVILRGEYIPLVLILTTVVLVGCGLVGYTWSVPRQSGARYFDWKFGLAERTSTALELASGRLTAPQDILHRQWEDALEVVRSVSIRDVLPLKVERFPLLISAGLLAAMFLIWNRGESYFQAAYQQRATSQAIQQEIKEIEALREAIASDARLSEEQKQALTRPLQEALKELQSAESLEQAVSALHSVEGKMQELAEAQAQANDQALRQVGEALSQASGSPLSSVGQSLAQGNYPEAAQQLANLDVSNLSPAQAEELADQLDQASQALSTTDPVLAEQLQAAADALRDGDTQAAQQALQQAAQAVASSGQQINQSQAASQIASSLGAGQQRLMQAGRSAQSGAGAGVGQGQGQGQGSSNQPGDGTGGGGAGRGEGGGDTSAGGDAGSSPIGQNNAPGDGGLRPYEQIYAPQSLGGSGGEDVTLPGSGQPGEQVVGQGNASPGEEDQSLVPYVDVLPYYAEAIRQAMDQGEIPVTFRALVWKYFSSLQP